MKKKEQLCEPKPGSGRVCDRNWWLQTAPRVQRHPAARRIGVMSGGGDLGVCKGSPPDLKQICHVQNKGQIPTFDEITDGSVCQTPRCADEAREP